VSNQYIKYTPKDLIFINTTGFSMWPFLRTREKLVIKKICIEDLKVGDIILYRANNQLVLHRLVKKIKDKERCLIYSRGDSSSSPPELVTEQMYLGKAIGILRNGKMSDLTSWRQYFFNRCIALVAPLVSKIIKHLYRVYYFYKRMIRK
jgi:signal peptidase I